MSCYQGNNTTSERNLCKRGSSIIPPLPTGAHCVLIFTKAPVVRKEYRRDEDLPTVKENSAISCNIRVLLSTVELSLHPLSSHEVESVRKEKERLTAASAALSFPFMYTSLDWKVSLLSFMVPFFLESSAHVPAAAVVSFIGSRGLTGTKPDPRKPPLKEKE